MIEEKIDVDRKGFLRDLCDNFELKPCIFEA